MYKEQHKPAWAIFNLVGKCKDPECEHKGSQFNHLNRYGLCELCQQVLQDQVEQAEADAGWDPNP